MAALACTAQSHRYSGLGEAHAPARQRSERVAPTDDAAMRVPLYRHIGKFFANRL